MPIEHQIEKTHGKDIPADRARALCREYAGTQIERQKKDFIRLGVLGEWDHPYQTMAFKTEAEEIRALGRIFEAGYLFKGLKPVNWCFDCGSALAEAEVEYQDKVSPAVDVAFPLVDRDQLAAAFGVASLPEKVFAVIWTTTPWTLPANQALNVHPEHDYQLIDTPRGALVLAAELAESAMKRFGVEGSVLAVAKGATLENIRFHHPFYERVSPVYLAEYVTLDTGTGIVHSAPAYGVDDFDSCRRYGMSVDDILNPVTGNGRFVDSLPFFGGLNVWKANPAIIAKLAEVGHLLAAGEINHSYMHCWRHKTPVIYRATTQWFVGMDRARDVSQTLRKRALEAVDATRFYPEWGKSRLHAMIANRPDWCVSRQRNWGVPIPFFLHKQTGELHPRTAELVEEVAKRVEQGGIDAWFSLDAAELLGADANDYDKMRDTLDVWFDSGTTHWTVLRGDAHPDLAWPADLYLEGSDQHRGWFHSSLLTGCAMDGRAPYKALLTHGFVVDGRGHKMSKSKGNVVAPQEVSDSLGAEILRLWVAATDYSGELSISKEILSRVVEAYRRIRNTVRFLLANTADFDASRDALPVEEWLEIDRYALALTRQLQQQVTADYDRFEFLRVVQALQSFCSEDLGAFYLDILKDRLYTTAAGSRARRSAQSALYHILQALTRLMAPVLCFTAEEIWQVLSRNPDDSVMLQSWHVLPEGAAEDELTHRWALIREVRARTQRMLEGLRIDGKIGSSLQAEVEIRASGAQYEALASLGDDLRLVLICSKVTLVRAADAGAEGVVAVASSAEKCGRCWHYREDVGHDPAHPELCARCTSNLFGAGEVRTHA